MFLISSFPRWYMARCLFRGKKPGQEDELSVGVNRGLRRAITQTEGIMLGGNAFCESLIRATGNLDTTRMHAQRALLRSISYLIVWVRFCVLNSVVFFFTFLNLNSPHRTRPDCR